MYLRIVLPGGLIDVLVVCAVCISAKDLRARARDMLSGQLAPPHVAVTAVPVALHGTSERCIGYIHIS